MEWINIKSEDKLSYWRKFRKDLEQISDNYEQLEKIAEFFSNMPFGHRSMDYYNPQSWSDPWEILYEGKYCPSSISLLIYYTASLIPNFKMEKKLLLIDDKTDIYLVPQFDKQYILNYELGKITTWRSIKKNVKILDTFDDSQIKRII